MSKQADGLLAKTWTLPILTWQFAKKYPGKRPQTLWWGGKRILHYNCGDDDGDDDDDDDNDSDNDDDNDRR